MKRRSLLVALALSVFVIWIVSVQTLAQSDDVEWATPVNLSDSGAASSPAIVVAPDGTLRILWWDNFDGLMVSDGSISALGAAGVTGPVSETVEAWSTPAKASIPVPDGTTPQIVSDADGRAHAFWLGQPNAKTSSRALVASRLALGETTWVTPTILTGAAASLDATTDLSGTLHVAYVQPVQGNEAPVGLYYRQSGNGGADWSAPAPIFLSRYLRLLSDAQNDLRLTAFDPDRVYATWNDPQKGQVSASHSGDSGATWSEPLPYTGSTDRPWEYQAIALPGRSAPLLWDRTDEGLGLVAVSASDDALTLVVWDGARWSETRQVDLRFQDPERGEPLSLSGVRIALASPSRDQAEAGEKLVVVGLDQRDDLWVSGIEMDKLGRRLFSPTGDSALQESGDGQVFSPPAPSNLSQSGAASNPIVVSVLGDALRVFWWDRFDGLTIADGTVSASSGLSGTQQIEVVRDSWSEPRPLPLPVTTIPRILTDARGRVHAFWLEDLPGEQQPAGQGPGEAATRILMHGQLATDGTAWLPPVSLTESAASFDVAADVAGGLHLAYVQAEDTENTVAGIYYRRTEEEGAGWSAPVGLDQSRYYRLLSPEAAYIRLVTDDEGRVYATWDEPRQGQLSLAYSPDAGETWEVTQPAAESEVQTRQAFLVPIPGGETLLLWNASSSGVACSLYQAPAAQVASTGTASGQQVLEELLQCPESVMFLPFGEGQSLMVANVGSDALTLAAWNGERWSEPRRLAYSFTDPEIARQIYLTNLQAALIEPNVGSSGGLSDSALIVVGVDLEGDVWVTSSQMGTVQLIFAPLPPWSTPVEFAQSEGVSGLPAIASDSEGQLHVLWTDAPARSEPAAMLLYARRDEVSTSSGSEARWTSPATVSRASGGEVAQPALVVTGDRLHAVWRGGKDAEIYYSQAFASDAHLARGGWREALAVSAPGALASWPDIAVDGTGTLHVVYAVPINEGRGIYYTRSEDGETWSETRQVFDAAGAGWVMSDYPRLAVDIYGAIHVVWLHATPLGRGMTQEIYYARSLDGGESWSEPLKVAEGACDLPEIVVGGAGTVQLLWNEASGEQAWWHQWSADGGIEWTRPERVPGFRNVPGPIGLVAGGNGTAHLVGLGHDNSGAPALLYLTWDGQRWGAREAFRLDLGVAEPLPGVSAAALPALGKLDAVFRGEGVEGESQGISLWHSAREILVVDTIPVPTITPGPAQTPLPTATPLPLPTPTRSFSQALPPDAGGSVANLLPLLLAGGLALLILAGIFGIGILRARRT